ncbi:MAG: pentapeptide repeat-containing protein [Gemmataceae bacterium]
MDSATTLDADQAKELLREGQAIENATIEALSWSKQTFTTPIVLTDCEIGTLTLSNCVFQEELILRRCRIKLLVLSNSTFEKKCDLKGATVFRIRGQEVTFQGGLNCGQSRVAGSFHKSQFHGKTDFGWSKIEGDATFTETQFHGELDFRNTRVTGDGIFEGAKCHGAARFDSSTFGGELKLNKTTWHDELKLARSRITLGVDLTHATLHKATDFRDMTVGRTVKLWYVELGEQQGFRFRGLVSASVSFQRQTVEGHILAEKEGDFKGAAVEYGFLRNMFQEIHRYDDEDWAYYKYKRMHRKSKTIGMNPLKAFWLGCEYLFLDMGCGYGTRPFRTLIACFLMIMVFAIGYLLGLPGEAQEDYGLGMFNKLVYSFDLSLQAFSGSYTDLHGGLRLLGIAEYMLGVVFLGLFVVALSRKVIR